MILNSVSTHAQKCLYCNDFAVLRVGIDVDLHSDGNIRSGYIYLCMKHRKYMDVIHNVKDLSCFTDCLRELR